MLSHKMSCGKYFEKEEFGNTLKEVVVDSIKVIGAHT
jgi:hypothetical protein